MKHYEKIFLFSNLVQCWYHVNKHKFVLKYKKILYYDNFTQNTEHSLNIPMTQPHPKYTLKHSKGHQAF